MTNNGTGRYEGSYEGVMTYKYVITKHIDKCAEASIRLVNDQEDPLKWVHGWGIMVAVLERLAAPYLKKQSDEEAVDHGKYLRGEDPASYLLELLDRFEHIVTTLHRDGVIHPKNVPTEDARDWFLALVGVKED